ncbi:MAG: ketol-acid reductoisomerase [Candidatus Coatesbacteria bacterium]|nr:MAG: ketol-acid reductoisomerase [Candidatus Coatesbacteria bacterium]
MSNDVKNIIVHRDGDIDLDPVLGRKIAVIGYGNQGRAQALNLKDSGLDVIIGLRLKSQTRADAESDGFPVYGIAETVATADIVTLLVPDEAIPAVFEEEVGPALKQDSQLLFAHGAAVQFGGLALEERYDVLLVAPMGPGRLLRELYLNGSGLNAKAAVYQDVTGKAWDVAFAYAKALGCGRLGVIKTTFEAEAVMDLFGEQAVLCGGIPALAEAAFNTLVEAGYPPALAYVECVREIKYIADLLFEYGLSGMRERISYTALYGGVTRGSRLIDERIKNRLAELLKEIRGGEFYAEFTDSGKTRAELLENLENERIEKARVEYESICSAQE